MANNATPTPGLTPSPAETLRRAAELMRERANGATPGPWVDDNDSTLAWCVYSPSADIFVTDPTAWDMGRGDSEHIASWHPTVAVAVAAWLDLVSRAVIAAGGTDAASLATQANYHAALDVARAYLGEAA